VAKNPVPWIVGGALIVLFVVIAAVGSGGGSKSKSKAKSPPEGGRAVVLPVERSRTVVVPPCSTPVSTTARNAAAGRATPGATAVALPEGPGVRTLLVPHCLPRTGATNAAGNLPSAAFIVAGSERLTEGQEGAVTAAGITARSKLILPDGSDATTIVVPPCRKKATGKGRDTVLSAARRSPKVVVAPSC
jgi:hypothetical protein